MTSYQRNLTRVQCEILVRGPVEASWLDELGDLSVGTTQTESGAVSTLSGYLVDQAALMGVLNGLDGLGLRLFSIYCRSIEFQQAPANR